MYVLSHFPATTAIAENLRSAATFGPVETHRLFQQLGVLLVKYRSYQSANVAYGESLPGPIYFTSGTSDLDRVH